MTTEPIDPDPGSVIPCKQCRRHIRSIESSCPFCGQLQRSINQPASMLGALVLANMFVMTGCANEPEPVGDDDVGSASSDATEGSTTSSGSESDVTESEVTDTDDSVDSIDDNGISFYAGPSPDGWGSNECDPFMQDCPDGEKCVPYASSGGAWDANKCVPVTGDGQAGDPCMSGGLVEATDDCDAESICWDVMDVEGQELGTCTPFCTGTADVPICDPGSACVISNQGSINLCLDECDPLLQDCGVGLGCYWTNANFLCISTVEDIPSGGPCGYINDCIAGNYCADAATLPACEGSACCASYCDLADPICSVAGTECAAFFDMGMAPAGYENVGLCLIPA